MTVLGIDITTNDPTYSYTDVKSPKHNNHPMEYYRMMDDADMCDEKAVEFASAMETRNDFTPALREEMQGHISRLQELAVSLRRQAIELDTEYWKAEINAQMQDRHEWLVQTEELRHGG